MTDRRRDQVLLGVPVGTLELFGEGTCMVWVCTRAVNGRATRGILSRNGTGADGAGGRQQMHEACGRESWVGHANWAWCTLVGLAGLLTCAGPGLVSCSRLPWVEFGPDNN